MKKVITMLLAFAMVFTLAACGNGSDSGNPSPGSGDEDAKSSLKIGVILIGDRSDMGYTYNHVIGFEKMQENLGIADEQIIYKTNISEDSSCDTAVRELVEAGCQIIFANSFGHEPYMVEVASEHPEVEFCHGTGYVSATDELDNTHNYFAAIHEARYLAGISAGLKAKEIGNPKLGYVAAKSYAEVISGYTAFYLGAQSVNPDVTMDVIYTNEWSDATLEAQAAQALIDSGCGVISQHSDTTAPATTAESAGVFQVGYNADMISAAPNASLVSARIDWGVYYTFAVQCMIDGTDIPQDWCKGLADGAVYLSPLNDAIIAEGTKEAIETAQASLIDGSSHVFDGPLSGAGVDFSGNPITIDIAAGEHFPESETASAPAWCYIIDGVTVISD